MSLSRIFRLLQLYLNPFRTTIVLNSVLLSITGYKIYRFFVYPNCISNITSNIIDKRKSFWTIECFFEKTRHVEMDNNVHVCGTIYQ